jgi:hypothetical protein
MEMLIILLAFATVAIPGLTELAASRLFAGGE